MSLGYQGNRYSRRLLSLHDAFGELNPKTDLLRGDEASKHVYILQLKRPLLIYLNTFSNPALPTDYCVAKVNTKYSLLYLAD